MSAKEETLEREQRELLRRFCEEMYKWETDCADREARCDRGDLDYGESQQRAMDEYARLFSKFCAGKELRDYHFLEPPEYDPTRFTIQTVEQTGEGRATLFATTTVYNRNTKFYLVREAAQWLIERKCVLQDSGEELPSPP